MAKELDKIDYRFKTRLKIIAMQSGNGQLTEVDVKKGEYYVGKPLDARKITKAIRDSIDDGVPVLWSLQLGQYPEKPQLNPQTSGGHMRLIIGYNEDEDIIIFSDSWGAGHEFKTMQAKHAYTNTRNFQVEWPSDFFARSRRDEGVVRAPQPRSNADIAKKAPVPSDCEA